MVVVRYNDKVEVVISLVVGVICNSKVWVGT